MNFNFYISGTPEGRYSQYPDDYTVPTLSSLQAGTDGARLVIYRDMDLVHYVYSERLGEKDFIGFCLIFNKARITRPRGLIKLLRFIVEKHMIESGNIIRYTDGGELKFCIKALNECRDEYDRLHEYINAEFENNPSQYGIEPLTAIYNGVKSVAETDRNASDAQIISLTDAHNKVIVNEYDGVEHEYIPQVISTLREQNRKAAIEIRKLQEETTVLRRKKKQYRYVVLLSLVVTACLSGLFLFYNEITDKSQAIAELGETVLDRDRAIARKDSAIAGLEASMTELRSEMEKMSSFASTTGATIRNNDNHDNGWIMWLEAKQRVRIESFYVKGGSSGSVKIGLYDANDNLVASAEASVSDSEFRKIQTSDSWTIGRGTYYMRIISGTSLQYHSSSDKEYGQFSNDALAVSGCCSYGDRKESGARTRHSYYQYFYNIRYRYVR